MTPKEWLHWIKRHWLMLGVYLVILLPGAGFILVSAALLIYTYWPTDFSRQSLPDIKPGSEHIVLIAHGLRDNPTSWSDDLKKRFEHHWTTSSQPSQVISLDWQTLSKDTFRCSVNGKRLGNLLAKHLTTSSQLQSVHLIGHSCGAFVVLGLCESLKASLESISIQTTYLDPVSIYGGLFWNYGIEHFGQCADFSDAYIDRDDGVPGSNQLLPNTHTFDVTEARKKAGFRLSPHVWPTVFYPHRVNTGDYPSLRDTPNITELYPMGVMTLKSQL